MLSALKVETLKPLPRLSPLAADRDTLKYLTLLYFTIHFSLLGISNAALPYYYLGVQN